MLHPSLLVFDRAWRATLARYAPHLLRTLVLRMCQDYPHNVVALQLIALANRQLLLYPWPAIYYVDR